MECISNCSYILSLHILYSNTQPTAVPVQCSGHHFVTEAPLPRGCPILIRVLAATGGGCVQVLLGIGLRESPKGLEVIEVGGSTGYTAVSVDGGVPEWQGGGRGVGVRVRACVWCICSVKKKTPG